MNVRSMRAVFGASNAGAAGALRGFLSLAGAIFALAAGAAHAQTDADGPSDTGVMSAALQKGSPVLGIPYENTFGRRLAKAVGLLFDPESVLKNLPVPAYPMNEAQRYLCENEGGSPGGDVREEIAIVRRAGRPEDTERFSGWKFAPDESGAALKPQELCDRLDELDLRRMYLEPYIFDVMGRRGTWRALEESEIPTGVERIMRGSASGARREDSVAWWGVRGKVGGWTVAWRTEDARSSASASELERKGSTWWVYRPERSSGGVEKEASGEEIYLSYPGPGEDSATVSACGVGLDLGAVGCQMAWDAAPARPTDSDSSKEFSLWTQRPGGWAADYVKGESSKVRGEFAAAAHSETSKPDWDDWYLLTLRPLPWGKAELLIERAAFR